MRICELPQNCIKQSGISDLVLLVLGTLRWVLTYMYVHNTSSISKAPNYLFSCVRYRYQFPLQKKRRGREKGNTQWHCDP